MSQHFCRPLYVSWKPDPGAKFVNAFHMNWAHSYFNCFPPSSVIASCLQKIEFHAATGVILIPLVNSTVVHNTVTPSDRQTSPSSPRSPRRSLASKLNNRPASQNSTQPACQISASVPDPCQTTPACIKQSKKLRNLFKLN